GGVEIPRLRQLLQTDGDDVAMVCVELLNNAAGGSPVSLNQLERVKAAALEANVPLVLDSTRLLRNAVLIKRHEAGWENLDIWDIARKLTGMADHVVSSLTKDFAITSGGLIATNDDQLAHRIGAQQLATGLALSTQ